MEIKKNLSFRWNNFRALVWLSNIYIAVCEREHWRWLDKIYNLRLENLPFFSENFPMNMRRIFLLMQYDSSDFLMFVVLIN